MATVLFCKSHKPNSYHAPRLVIFIKRKIAHVSKISIAYDQYIMYVCMLPAGYKGHNFKIWGWETENRICSWIPNSKVIIDIENAYRPPVIRAYLRAKISFIGKLAAVWIGQVAKERTKCDNLRSRKNF